jgi:hypothetical protein
MMNSPSQFSKKYCNGSNFSAIEAMKKKRKRVTFSTQTNVKEIGNCKSNGAHPSNDSNRTVHSTKLSERWYSPSELECMRNDVKIQAMIHRKFLNKDALFDPDEMSSLVKPFQNSGVEQKMTALCQSSSTFRGLESRIFSEKQRNRLIATSTVLEYQRRTVEILKTAKQERISDIDVKDMKRSFANRLGNICEHLSKWSLDEAHAIARYDANGVYNPTNAHNLLSNQIKTMSINGTQSSQTNSTNLSTNIRHLNSRKRSSEREILTPIKRPRSVSPCTTSHNACHRISEKNT